MLKIYKIIFDRSYVKYSTGYALRVKGLSKIHIAIQFDLTKTQTIIEKFRFTKHIR